MPDFVQPAREAVCMTDRRGPVALLTLVLVVACIVPAAAHGQQIYVANSGANTVSVIDSETNRVVGSPIPVGLHPGGIAVGGDGTVYVANSGDKSVSVIDGRLDRVIGNPIALERLPSGITITPDGERAYVTSSFTEDASLVDLATKLAIGPPFPVGGENGSIAITPDGSTAYKTNGLTNTITVIDTATNQIVKTVVAGGMSVGGIVVVPRSTKAYVANRGSNDISVLDTRTSELIGSPIQVGTSPGDMAVSPDGKTIYVTGGRSVLSLDVATDELVGQPIPTGTVFPRSIAIAADGRTAYVTNAIGPNTVLPIDLVKRQALAPVEVGDEPAGIAVQPGLPRPRITIARGKARIRGRRALLSLSCEIAECRGGVTLTIRVRQRSHPSQARTLAIGRGHYVLADGASRNVAIRLTSRGQALIEHFHHMRVHVRASVLGGKNARRLVILR